LHHSIHESKQNLLDARSSAILHDDLALMYLPKFHSHHKIGLECCKRMQMFTA
jgi:hypothetical protein